MKDEKYYAEQFDEGVREYNAYLRLVQKPNIKTRNKLIRMLRGPHDPLYGRKSKYDGLQQGLINMGAICKKDIGRDLDQIIRGKVNDPTMPPEKAKEAKQLFDKYYDELRELYVSQVMKK